MLLWSTLSAATGCGMFQQKQQRPKKEGAQTVEDWIGLKRVPPFNPNRQSE
jgi:hypothetical protein